MKKIVVILLFLVLSSTLFAQKANLSRKERRAQKAKAIAMHVDSILTEKHYRFIAQNANPMGWQSINLSSVYDLKVSGDSVYVNLPYFGRAYRADLTSGEGGIHLENIIEDYTIKESKKRYEVSFNAVSENDRYKFHLSISESGFANLSVISNNRQGIDFSGVLDLYSFE